MKFILFGTDLIILKVSHASQIYNCKEREEIRQKDGEREWSNEFPTQDGRAGYSCVPMRSKHRRDSLATE